MKSVFLGKVSCLLMTAAALVSLQFIVLGQNKNAAQTETRTTREPKDQRIFIAAFDGDDKLIERFVRRGVTVNQKNKYGETPLHLAVSNKKRTVKTVIALLEAGADINARSSSGQTPLLYSMYWAGADEYTKVLLEYGADVNIARDNGETPLHVASGRTNTEISKLLLSKGADPNCLNDDGESPFMMAVRNGQDIEVIRLFIEKGANIHLINKDGKSILKLAEEELQKRRSENGKKRMSEIIEELKKAGAD